MRKSFTRADRSSWKRWLPHSLVLVGSGLVVAGAVSPWVKVDFGVRFQGLVDEVGTVGFKGNPPAVLAGVFAVAAGIESGWALLTKKRMFLSLSWGLILLTLIMLIVGYQVADGRWFHGFFVDNEGSPYDLLDQNEAYGVYLMLGGLASAVLGLLLAAGSQPGSEAIDAAAGEEFANDGGIAG